MCFHIYIYIKFRKWDIKHKKQNTKQRIWMRQANGVYYLHGIFLQPCAVDNDSFCASAIKYFTQSGIIICNMCRMVRKCYCTTLRYFVISVYLKWIFRKLETPTTANTSWISCLQFCGLREHHHMSQIKS